jgi:ABC-2 type transport system ATP-binding protein
MSMNVVEASGLGKRYGGTWALRACSLAIPAGHVAALVGPNGAGKTTLLNLAVGLAAPSAGGVTVLGGLPAGSPEALDGIAFVAQDTPVYRNLSVADMLHLTRSLNRRFDQSYARARLNELGIPLKRKAGRLSGGQQAQLALTLALARPPRPVILPNGRMTRSRRAGRRTRSAWKNSSWPTCASPAPQRCPARRIVIEQGR